MRPNVFIGSSTQSIEIANEIQVHLEYYADCTVWNQDLFYPSSQTLLRLQELVENFDFGIFIFSDDDVIKINGKEYMTARDNVIFELGLFIGHLGIERSFIVTPRDVENLRLPTDLLGITPVQFFLKRDDENLNAALGPTCNKIRKRILELGKPKKELKSSLFNETIIHQAAAICYKKEGPKIFVLLIKTSGGRWSFPKGTLSTSKSHSETARSEAYNEAGIISSSPIEYLDVYHDIKINNKKQTNLTIAGFMIKTDKEIEPYEQNRYPTWFDIDNALEELSQGRKYNQITSLENILNKVRTQLLD